jgi:hypothetical protein
VDGNKKKKRKAEQDAEAESSVESDWEEYRPELWEEIEPTFASVATLTTTPAASETKSTVPLPSANQQVVATSEAAKLSTVEIQKPPRKQRMPREAKRDNDSKRNEIRLDTQFAQSNNSALFRTHLPGVISCPNKRYKAVVEIR